MAGLYDDLAQHYKHRLASVESHNPDHDNVTADNYRRYLDLSRALLEVERQTALRLRDEGRVTDEVLREMEHELDLNETRLMAAKKSRSRMN